MKKIFSKILTGIGALLMVFSLVACGVSQSYADKINEAAKAKEYITWSEVIDELGTDYTGLSGGTNADNVTGIVIWYKGYKSYDEAKEAVDDGKTVKMISITFLLGKAQSASYEEWKKD